MICESCLDSGEEYIDDSGDDSPRPWAGWLPCRECRPKEHNREWDNRFVCQYEGNAE